MLYLLIKDKMPPKKTLLEETPKEDDGHHDHDAQAEVFRRPLSPSMLALCNQWIFEQTEIAKAAVIRDGFVKPITHVGGTDISFVPNTNTAVACVVSMTFPELKVVASRMQVVELTVPYIPNFLAFREVKPLQSCVELLRKECADVFPQVWLVDGNGTLHPRRAGLATHLGVLCNIPTIGVAKNLLAVEGLSDTIVNHALSTVKHGEAATAITRDR